jgi:hypothetical protein
MFEIVQKFCGLYVVCGNDKFVIGIAWPEYCRKVYLRGVGTR